MGQVFNLPAKVSAMNRNLLFVCGLLVLVVVAVLVVTLSQQPHSVAPNTIERKQHAPKPEPKVTSPIKSDEQVIFYPTLGWPTDDKPDADWEIEIHGCIFEAGRHAAGVKLVRELTGIDDAQLAAEELRTFQQRAELFAVDHERGKAIPIRIGERAFTLPESEANGHFQTRLRLTQAEVNAASAGKFRELPFAAILPKLDSRAFLGTVHLVPKPPVWHVLSDIDDTIKISQVRNKPELLLNTFCRPFRPVPGMAELYRSWSADDVRFHYVSASPWQLFSPLVAFTREHDFPAGAFHMKLFRLQDRTALNLFGSQEEYKRGVIEPLLKQFPHDRFVLVGDSGEQDPKIYAGLARDYPQQVSHIFIRNVTNETPDTFRDTFTDLPADRWQVFREPSEIKFTPN